MARSKRAKPSPVELSNATLMPEHAATNGLPVDPALQAWLADLGELAGPLAHGFSNFLNVVLLHTAVLEQEGPASLREDLAEIRRQGTAMDAWIKRFHKHRQESRSSKLKVDLNQAVRSGVEAWTAQPSNPRASLQLDLAPALPAIGGCGADVRRLVRLLLAQAAAAAGAAGSITVRTRAADAVTLSVADNGPAPALDQFPRMFETMDPVRAGTSALELAACRALVRRLGGSIQASAAADGGVAILVELPRAGP